MEQRYGKQVSVEPSPQQAPAAGPAPAYGNGMLAQGLAEGWLTAQGDGVAPDPELAAFLARRFTLKNHQPSTGLGCFDASYDPKAGVMDVVLKLAFTFTLPHDASPLEKAKAIWNGTDGWTDEEKQEWLAEFQRSVEASWSTDHVIRCVRPGWGLQVRPRLRIEAVEDGASHYAVTVHKSSGVGSDFRPGVVDQRRTAFLEEDHTREGSLGPAVADEEIRRVKAMTERPILFDLGGPTPVLPASERARVEAMAAETRGLPPGTPKLNVDVDAWGDTQRDTGELEAAQEVAALMPAPHTWIADNWGSNEPGQVTFDVGVHPDDVDYEGRFQYASHEVGHMLGLTDEYGGNDADPQQVAAHDALIEASGADSLRRGADTTSIMSQGGDVLTGHLVTMWEALGIMTAPALDPKEWQL